VTHKGFTHAFFFRMVVRKAGRRRGSTPTCCRDWTAAGLKRKKLRRRESKALYLVNTQSVFLLNFPASTVLP